jgi:glycosyltransferase involved in cell wall biosynthesis
MRLAIVTSHPIQYQAPIFRRLAQLVDLTVFYACHSTPDDQAKAGFGVAFDWDVDLTSGFEARYLENVSIKPGPSHFAGCDTPSVGAHLRKGKFDAVLVLGWHLKTHLQTILAAKLQRVPLLVRGDSQLGTPRSLPKRLAKELIYRPGLRVFDAALYVGRHSRAYWDHYGYPAHRLFFSPHCVDTLWFRARATPEARIDLRQKLGISAGQFVALFAGKLVDFKRPLDLIAGAARAAGPEGQVDVMVAGAGPLQKKLEDASRQQGVRLHLLGFCNQTEMPPAYAAADVLVLPSNGRETWGLVANEAQACGLPIIVSDACGCAPDLAADGIAGRIFPLGDVDALAAALAAVKAQPPSRVAILERSDAYSIEAACSGIVAALQSLSPARAGQGRVQA